MFCRNTSVAAWLLLSALGLTSTARSELIILKDGQEVEAALESIEADSGRERGDEKFGPRTLDLDLLLYGDEVIDGEGRKVPREEITRYAFVLKPLADLAGDKLHPVSGRSFSLLWQEFDQDRHPLEAVNLPLVV